MNDTRCHQCAGRSFVTEHVRTDDEGRHYFVSTCMACEHQSPEGRTEAECFDLLSREPWTEEAKFLSAGPLPDLSAVYMQPLPSQIPAGNFLESTDEAAA